MSFYILLQFFSFWPLSSLSLSLLIVTTILLFLQILFLLSYYDFRTLQIIVRFINRFLSLLALYHYFRCCFWLSPSSSLGSTSLLTFDYYHCSSSFVIFVLLFVSYYPFSRLPKVVRVVSHLPWLKWRNKRQLSRPLIIVTVTRRCQQVDYVSHKQMTRSYIADID